MPWLGLFFNTFKRKDYYIQFPESSGMRITRTTLSCIVTWCRIMKLSIMIIGC